MTLTTALIIWIVGFIGFWGLVGLGAWIYCKGFANGVEALDNFNRRAGHKPVEKKLYDL